MVSFCTLASSTEVDFELMLLAWPKAWKMMGATLAVLETRSSVDDTLRREREETAIVKQASDHTSHEPLIEE